MPQLIRNKVTDVADVLIDPHERHQQDVHLRHPEFGDLGTGTLAYGGEQWPSIVLDTPLPISVLTGGTRCALLKAKTRDQQLISLVDCTVGDGVIHVDYLVFGNIQAPAFKRVDLRFSDITKWFTRGQSLDGAIGQSLTWNRRPTPIEVALPDAQIAIRSRLVGRGEQRGEDFVLHEHLEFVVENTGGTFRAADLPQQARDIGCLFTILRARPLVLTGMSVVTDDGRRHTLYFPGIETAKTSIEPGDPAVGSLIRKNSLDGRWQTIFERYYASPLRKLLWRRFAGMQQYEGYWEYRVLGFVSLLDQYVQQKEKGSAPPGISHQDSRKLRKLEQAITAAAVPLSNVQRDALLREIGAVFCRHGKQSFARNYRKVMATTDPDIVRIINISEQHFEIIKDVRDAIAHSDEPPIDHRNLTDINVIVAKITLLLTYCAYIDFGLSKQDFLKSLRGNSHRLPRMAQLDEVHLDRVARNTEFLPVSAETWKTLMQTRHRHMLCLVQTASGELEFSEHYTKHYADWLKHPHDNPHTIDTIFGIPADGGRFLNRVYIEHGGQTMELHVVYLLYASHLPPNERDLTAG